MLSPMQAWVREIQQLVSGHLVLVYEEEARQRLNATLTSLCYLEIIKIVVV